MNPILPPQTAAVKRSPGVEPAPKRREGRLRSLFCFGPTGAQERRAHPRTQDGGSSTGREAPSGGILRRTRGTTFSWRVYFLPSFLSQTSSRNFLPRPFLRVAPSCADGARAPPAHARTRTDTHARLLFRGGGGRSRTDGLETTPSPFPPLLGRDRIHRPLASKGPLSQVSTRHPPERRAGPPRRTSVVDT